MSANSHPQAVAPEQKFQISILPKNEKRQKNVIAGYIAVSSHLVCNTKICSSRIKNLRESQKQVI